MQRGAPPPSASTQQQESTHASYVEWVNIDPRATCLPCPYSAEVCALLEEAFQSTSKEPVTFQNTAGKVTTVNVAKMKHRNSNGSIRDVRRVEPIAPPRPQVHQNLPAMIVEDATIPSAVAPQYEQDHHRELLWNALNVGATKDTIMEQVNWFIGRRLPLPLSNYGVTVLFEACRQRDGRLIDVDLVDSLLQCCIDPSGVSGPSKSTPAHAIIQGLSKALDSQANVNGIAEDVAAARIANCRRAMQLLLVFGANLFCRNQHSHTAAGDVARMMSQIPTQYVDGVFSVIETRTAPVVLVSCSDEDRLQLPGYLFEDPVAKRQFSRECGLIILEGVLSGCDDEDGEVHIELESMNGGEPVGMSLFPHKLNGFIDSRAVGIAVHEWPQSLGVEGCAWEYLVPATNAWMRADALLTASLNAMQDRFVDSSGVTYEIGQRTFELIGEGQPLHGAMCRWKPQTDADMSPPEELETEDEEASDDDAGVERVDAVEAVSLPLRGPSTTVPRRNDSLFSQPLAAADMCPAAITLSVGESGEAPISSSTIAITFPSTDHFLRDAYVQLVITLPRQLRLESLDAFHFDEKHNALVITGSEEQRAQATAVTRAIDAVSSHIDELRMKIVREVEHRWQTTVDRLVRSNNVKLRSDDPILQQCRAYMAKLRAHYVTHIEMCETSFEQLVKNRASEIMKCCCCAATDSAVVAAVVQDMLDAVWKEFDSEIGPQTYLIIFSRFLDERTPTAFEQSSCGIRPAQLSAFVAFKKAILERASTKFFLPVLLRDFDIHCVSALRGLTFYEHTAKPLIDAVAKHDVVVVATGTGSGKSTLMPLLLLASGMGLERIAVTQPRRFAAESIAETLTSLHGDALIGYSMAGRSKNLTGNIVYVTDGLLRHSLHPDRKSPYDLIIIDEVHERSKEIDGCVALLALMRAEGKQSVPKIVLSSATFDASIERPLREAGLSVFHLEQEPPLMHRRTEHYSDKPCKDGCTICQDLKRHAHHIHVVSTLQKTLVGSEQLLLFLPSRLLVDEAIKELEQRHIAACPLYAAQTPTLQSNYLKHGWVFVSTNIAETSLTFPNLRYVVDLGKAQRPRMTSCGLKMETVDAPVSTLRQRLGRIGRTCDGDYVALYPHHTVSSRLTHIEPKLEVEGDEDFLFSLQKQLRRAAKITLPRAGPTANVTLDTLANDFYKYPALGTAAMTKAFHESRDDDFASEFNLVCIAAARKSMSTKVLQEICKVCKKTFNMPGDITGLNAMMLQAVTIFDEKVKSANKEPPRDAVWQRALSNAANWFNTHGLGRYIGPLQRALVEAVSLLNRLGAQGIQIRKQYPENALAVLGPLLKTHPRHVFLALAPIFGGPINYYTRGVDCGDLGDSERDDDTTQLRTIASFHCQSSMHKLEPQPPVVLALDFMLFNAEMKYVEDPYQIGVMQNCDPVDIGWLSSIIVKKRRILLLNKTEADRAIAKKLDIVSVPNAKFGYVHLQGPLPKVIEDAKTLIKTTLRVENVDIAVELYRDNGLLSTQIQSNIKDLRKNQQFVFRQMKFQWKNTCQMDVVVNLEGDRPRVTVSGRLGDADRLAEQLKFWSRMLGETPTVHIPFGDHLESFESFVRPRHIGPNDAEFRHRLRLVTRENVPAVELWSQVHGPQATRESRMAMVARIAVLEYGCRISGGFVRDWIVNGERRHPPARPDPKNLFSNAWVETCSTRGRSFIKYNIREGVLPKDIDVELPASQYFDVNRFISRVRECGVSVDHHEHITQRHVFLFDLEKGPFGMDCVEFHFAALHTMMDFDVNALALMKPCEDLVGLKIPFKELKVDDVMERCFKKEMWQLRLLDGPMKDRIDKMTARGWKISNDPGKITYQPASEDGRTSLVTIHPEDPTVKAYFDEIGKLVGTHITGFKVENRLQQAMYESNKRVIAVENHGSANEMLLWHGTKKECGLGILTSGFDDRYWNGGHGAAFGRAAYFAPHAAMSVAFAKRGAQGERWLFVCKVALGNVQKNVQPGNPAFHVQAPYHSASGREIHWHPSHDQYMVYRYGQSVPLYLFRFQ